MNNQVIPRIGQSNLPFHTSWNSRSQVGDIDRGGIIVDGCGHVTNGISAVFSPVCTELIDLCDMPVKDCYLGMDTFVLAYIGVEQFTQDTALRIWVPGSPQGQPVIFRILTAVIEVGGTQLHLIAEGAERLGCCLIIRFRSTGDKSCQ